MGSDRERFERSNSTRGLVSPRPKRRYGLSRIIAKAVIVLVAVAVIFIGVFSVLTVLGKSSLNKKGAALSEAAQTALEAKGEGLTQEDTEIGQETDTIFYPDGLMSFLVIDSEKFSGGDVGASEAYLVVLDKGRKESRLTNIAAMESDYFKNLPVCGHILVNINGLVGDKNGMNPLGGELSFMLKEKGPSFLKSLNQLRQNSETDLSFNEILYLAQIIYSYDLAS